MLAYTTALLRGAKTLWNTSSRIRWLALFLLAMECFSISIIPAVVPEQWYFDRYIQDERSRQAISSFFDDKHFIIPDENVGWINRPGVVADGRNWIIDEHGSRSSFTFSERPAESKYRVIFLGSSMINGGPYANNNETISAYLSGPSIEGLNFGTMLYRVDQSYLAYKTRLEKYQAKMIVLGIDAYSLDMSGNIWIPFANRSEVNMPFVKPRLRQIGDQLTTESAPLGLLRESLSNSEPFVKYLSSHDDTYFAYEDFKRYGFTPITAFLNSTYRGAERLAHRWLNGPPSNAEKLTLAVLERFRSELQQSDKELVLLVLPRRGAIAGQRWSSDFRDHARTLQLLKNGQFLYIDAAEPLRALPIESVFGADGTHYNPRANREIAEYLASRMRSLSNSHQKIPEDTQVVK